MSQRLMRRLAAVAAAAALALAAGCGDDESGTTPPPAPPPASAPATTAATTPSVPSETSTVPTTLPTETTGPVDTGTSPSTPTAPSTSTTPTGSPEVEAYREEANGICRQARLESQELLAEVIQSGGEPSDDLVRRLFEGTAGIREDLAGVEPPAEVADAHQRMLDTYGQVVDRLNTLYEERGAEALDAAASDAELNRLGPELGQSWQELGLTECAMS